MVTISTSIEIAASPATVRARFLDFTSLPEYHRGGYFKVITTKTEGQELKPGTVMKVSIEAGGFEPVILENAPDAFVWEGSLPGIFTGAHAWRFLQGRSGPSSTTLIQEENFSGILSWVMGQNVVANAIGFNEKTCKGFERLNKDLKRACEQQ